MEVNCFQMLLVAGHILFLTNVLLNVLIKMKNRIYATPAVKGLNFLYAASWLSALALNV